MTPESPVPSDSSKKGGVATSSTSGPTIPDYELIRRIGQGSYGDVWLARGLTGVYRAIKIVWRDRFSDAEPFEREFKGLKKFMAMSLPEAGQLSLLHVGQNESAGFFYYVMELADDAERGRDIDPSRYVPLTLTEVRRRRGRLPAMDCVAYGVELARALAGLHSRGLVHRDIKPSNVILVGGVPKLADIGLVAETNDALSYVGTKGFVPPEGPGQPSADVFALGKLLYELGTGLDREEFPRLPPELSEVPDSKVLFGLNEVILRACEPMAGQRYRNADAILTDLLVLQAGSSARRVHTRTLLRRVGVGVALIALVAVGAVIWSRMHLASPIAQTAEVATAEAPAKSIAVLPFANLSEDTKATAFFSDGIQEDILTNLGLIRALRVVSRTSVQQYLATTKTAAQIGQELKVRYLLEGSVRRAGNKVRVTTQLIDASTDQHLWAQTYDRDLTDIFAIQSEIAQSIAGALQAELSTGEIDLLARRPTNNTAAYDLYLQARALKNSTVYSHVQFAELLKSAVQLDPRFAVAWAALGSEYAFVYLNDHDHSTRQLALAKEAIETAVRLAPDDPEVVECLGDYYYYGYRDYVRATEQYLRLLRLRPNDAMMHMSLGLIQRRQGRWDDAIMELQQALQLEPRNQRIALVLIRTLTYVNRYEEAEKLARQTVRDRPQDVVPAYYLSNVTFRARGSRVEGKELELRSFDPAQSDQLADSLRNMAAERGDWAAYLRMERAQRYIALGGAHWAQDVETALVLADSGDLPAARSRVDEVLPLMQAEVKHQPANSILLSSLAVAHALRGEKAEALRCADEVMRLRLEGRDAMDTPSIAMLRASVLARVGETDQALAELARLLRVPHGTNVYLARFGFYDGASFQPLRGDPRFEALLDDPANNAPITEYSQVQPALSPALAAPVDSRAVMALVPEAEKSLVVLPLENLSPDPANAYFTDGMHAEIIAMLGRASGLRVISRNSALAFKGQAVPLAEIGRRLGVANIITGSVQRAEGRVQIVLELRRASDEALLWSKTFNEKLDDIFALQTEIADQVSRALQARESKGTFAWAQYMTKDVHAYDLFLKSRALTLSTDRIPLLEEALRIDPGFLPAADSLSYCHLNLYYLSTDPVVTAQRAGEAKRWAETAARLGPGGTGNGALSAYYAVVEGDNVRALALAESMVRALPNDSVAHDRMEIALRGLGRKAEALAENEQALALDPLSLVERGYQVRFLARLRRRAEFEAAVTRYEAVAAEKTNRAWIVESRFIVSGELPETPAGLPPKSQFDWQYIKRQWPAALEAAGLVLADPKMPESDRLEWLGKQGDILRRLGRGDEALAVGRTMLALAEKLRGELQRDFWRADSWQMQALLCAGRGDEAVAAGRRYVEAASPTSNTNQWWTRKGELAAVYAALGKKRECMELLAPLIKVPSDDISVPVLRLSPRWDNVRDDPAFQALLADPKNSQPF